MLRPITHETRLHPGLYDITVAPWPGRPGISRDTTGCSPWKLSNSLSVYKAPFLDLADLKTYQEPSFRYYIPIVVLPFVVEFSYHHYDSKTFKSIPVCFFLTEIHTVHVKDNTQIV